MHGCIKIITQFGPLVKAFFWPPGLWALAFVRGGCRFSASPPPAPQRGLGDGWGQGGEAADGQGLPERGGDCMEWDNAAMEQVYTALGVVRDLGEDVLYWYSPQPKDAQRVIEALALLLSRAADVVHDLGRGA